VSRRAELEAVYRAAWYEVKTPDKNVRRFRVGERVPELDTLAAEKGWAWLSAFNPGSQLLSESENLQRHQALLNNLVNTQRAFLPAASGDDTGQWPVEHAVCLLNIDEITARALAIRHGQAAFLHAQPGEAVRLCWV